MSLSIDSFAICKIYSLLLYIAFPSRSPYPSGIHVEECNSHFMGLTDRQVCGKIFPRNTIV